MFFVKKIKTQLKGRYETEIIETWGGKLSSPYLLIPTNLFMQTDYFSKFDEYFMKNGDIIVPIMMDDQFLLVKNYDFKNAENLVKEYIIKNTGGYIAKRINKRISIPISLLLAKTRIHPNILTIFNMIIGIMSAVFLLFNTYWHIVLGGFFFQLASIMDGVDGEVAKFTLKVSKFEGWLDTISDNITHFLFLAAVSYLGIINLGGSITLTFIALMFIGMSTMLLITINYLRRYSDSASLNAYDREFIQSLPRSDPIVAFIHNMKYLIKKEFFALLFFLICLTGKTHYIIILTVTVITLGSIALISVNIKYLKTYQHKRKVGSTSISNLD